MNVSVYCLYYRRFRSFCQGFWTKNKRKSSFLFCPFGRALSDTFSAPSPCRRYDLPARPVWYRVQTGAACPAFGQRSAMVSFLPWFWHGLPCCLSCAGRPGALGVGVSPAGYMGRAGGGVVDTSRRKNSKKAFPLPTKPLFSVQNTPTPIANLKNSAQKQKDPYKGSVFCAILALQALKGRNLQWLKVK